MEGMMHGIQHTSPPDIVARLADMEKVVDDLATKSGD